MTLRRSQMPRRKSPLCRASAGRGKLRKVGKVGRRNVRALRVFKKDCAEQGVEERCERRGRNCTGTENLTWAHGRKRDELREGELEHFAIVCCVNCHREMDEGMSHEEMAAEVRRIINLRDGRRLQAA